MIDTVLDRLLARWRELGATLMAWQKNFEDPWSRRIRTLDHLLGRQRVGVLCLLNPFFSNSDLLTC